MKEIYNFVQDDLTTEDVLLLDCQSEIYVWIGSNSIAKSKKQALALGLVRFPLYLAYIHVLCILFVSSNFFTDIKLSVIEHLFSSLLLVTLQKFIEMDILEEGLTAMTPVYVVTEGHEPPFFTRFFEWNPEKANVNCLKKSVTEFKFWVFVYFNLQYAMGTNCR